MDPLLSPKCCCSFWFCLLSCTNMSNGSIEHFLLLERPLPLSPLVDTDEVSIATSAPLDPVSEWCDDDCPRLAPLELWLLLVTPTSLFDSETLLIFPDPKPPTSMVNGEWVLSLLILIADSISMLPEEDRRSNFIISKEDSHYR